MSRNRLKVIIIGVMLSLFLASVEGTIIATAMPTIVAQLGGLSIYSWVFAIYMLASTTTVPIYGKLSDIYGRKKVYTFAMVLFLIGSVLCGTANSMQQLIFFRAVQGLGAGGVLPLALIIIGELFSVEQRARMQGLFSGVWGVSSVIGPIIGGFLVDQISWQWVFYINIIPGALAILLVGLAWQEVPKTSEKKVQLDIGGAVFLTLSVLFLLLGLNELGQPPSWWFLSAAVGLFIGLYYVEKRAVDPILPLRLFRERLFIIAILHGILAGWAMFGSLSYIPLFVQAVLGTSATVAGITLTPMSLAWTLASIYGGHMVLKNELSKCGNHRHGFVIDWQLFYDHHQYGNQPACDYDLYISYGCWNGTFDTGISYLNPNCSGNKRTGNRYFDCSIQPQPGRNNRCKRIRNIFEYQAGNLINKIRN